VNVGDVTYHQLASLLQKAEKHQDETAEGERSKESKRGGKE